MKAIDWPKITKAINDKYQHVIPYSHSYIYAVYKGYTANAMIRRDIFELIEGKKI
jgi:hypothetical protein